MPSVYAAVIVAAGSSRRAGFDKLAAPLGDSTVLEESLRVFEQNPLISEIVVVTSVERFASLAARSPGGKRLFRVDGGEERHLSVLSGLRALHCPDFVAVHDGARPLLHPHQLARCLELVREHGAVASARPVVDTLKRATAEGDSVPETIDRNGLWAMETPQVFRYSPLLAAYAEVIRRGLLVTDEVSAMEAVGISTRLVANHWPNPKITLPGDLELASLIRRHTLNDC